ncbi:hypothetical protein [Desulfothermobacter acidiphilus]|uniref:hypothetical protein n=1 Tax=Desulfothermobacter acidiphilus TaxID=1938353 RepID=UPI003F8A4611
MWQFLSALGWLNIFAWLFSRRAWWFWVGSGLVVLLYNLTGWDPLWLAVCCVGGLWLFSARHRILAGYHRAKGGDGQA